MVRACLVALALVLAAGRLAAQELEPGLYQNAPVGINVAIAGVVFSTGNVLVDSSVPIADGRARIAVLGLGYVRTLRLFDHLAKVDAQLPLAWSRFTGVVNGENRTRDPNGLADPRVRLSVNLFGSPALDLPDFGKYRQRTIVGVGLQVAMPLGQYDPDRLVNLGSNRWSFRPEIGLSHARGRLVLEIASGSWLFTENDEYFGGKTLTQRPLYFVKVNGVYAIRRGVWTAVSYGRANGGETLVNGALASSLQRNDRASVVFAFPVPRKGGIKVTYLNGLSTRLGADFDSVGVAYQYTWKGRLFGR
jgi:outer membrane putative beta-barrel porin/alpha-amylase